MHRQCIINSKEDATMANDFGPKMTAKNVANLPVPKTKKEVRHTPLGALSGLSVVVQPSGKRSYHQWFRTRSGQTRRMHLGDHPQIDPMEAFRRGCAILARRDAGFDPAQELYDRIAKERRDRAETLDVVVPEFLSDYASQLRSHDECRRYFAVVIGPNLPKKPVRAYERRDIVELVDAVRKKHGPAVARNAYSWVSSFFRWANRKALLDANPCVDIELPKAVVRQRVLNDAELRLILRAASQLPQVQGAFVQCLAYLLQRRTETSHAGWAEIDPDQALWSIPAARMKMGLPHEVPLPTQVVTILSNLPRLNAHVFTTGDAPLGGYSQIKAQLIAEMRKIDPELTASMPSWRFHDLRRTGRTRLSDARLKVTPEIAERCIAHVPGGVRAAYDLHAYREEKRAALQAWADELDRIRRGESLKKVAAISA
jgi:integrase